MIMHKLKILKRLNICLLALLIVAAMGCTEGFTELNTPDDRLSTENLNASNLGQAFAHVQYTSAGGSAYQVAQNLFSDMYSQHFAQTTSGFESDNFVEVRSWSNRAWNRTYSTAGPELLFVQEFTEENDMPVHNAMAKIWSVYMFQQTTDYFGPIIYSEYGIDATTIPYDSQESVYLDFFTKLDEAVSVLEGASTSNAFGANDLVYGGNVDQWLKLANSLRLRVAMRIVYVMPDRAQSEAEKAVSGGVITDNADNASVATNQDSPNEFSRMSGWGEFRMSASMESVLKGYDDPRLEAYFDTASTGGYHGYRNGTVPASRDGVEANYSNINSYWQNNPNVPLPVIRAPEVYFLRAEGALRGWNMGGTAQDLYEEGIRQSMTLYPHTSATTAEINSYINSTNTPVGIDYANDDYDVGPLTDIPVAYQAAADFETKLEQIMTQKWVALFPNGWEAWAEYRRTRYPNHYPIIQSLNPKVGENGIFRRMRIPTGEYDNNTQAAENAANNLLNGPDQNDTRLWWDAKE